MDLSAYPYKVLETKDDFKFDCGDADLNEFFHKDAIPHKRELIGVTYFFYDDKDKDKSTRTMRYDLKPYSDKLNKLMLPTSGSTYSNR